MEGEKKRRLVLIHGAYHGAWCWYKVSTLLNSAGLQVTSLDMPASGIDPKQVLDITSVSEYVEPLFQFLRSLPAEERVILVGHSFGGLCISLAMESFPHKIAAAVFLTGWMPGPHLSYLSLMQEVPTVPSTIVSSLCYSHNLIYFSPVQAQVKLEIQFGRKDCV